MKDKTSRQLVEIGGCTGHKTIQLLSVIIGIALLIWMIIISAKDGVKIDNIHAKTMDNEIVVSWDISNVLLCDSIEVEIRHGGVIEDVISLYPSSDQYIYRTGKHGEKYQFSIYAVCKDVRKSFGMASAMFLGYKELPSSIPILDITTYSGNDPSYKVLLHPNEETMGDTITDNYYLKGYAVSDCLPTEIPYELEIKVRGNGSTLQEKNSYKLKFDRTVSFACVNNLVFESKEWLLLNNADSLNTIVGNEICRYCDIDWTMDICLTNVMVNGDWKGLYYLTPAITKDNSSARINSSGYLIESDIYWWDKNGLYFETGINEVEKPYFRWTFKYPSIKYIDDERVHNIKDYLEDFEKELNEGDEWQEYIDVNSFAKWALARDIIGVHDGAGSNMFYYKENYNVASPTSTKLMMGPVWDFDSAFLRVDAYSSISAPYFKELFKKDEFSDIYWNLYNEKSVDLVCHIDQYMDLLYDDFGVGIDESWLLENARYEKTIVPYNEQRKVISSWLLSRTIWLDNEMK